MKNKGFVIVIIVISLLIGCVVWQQINIMGIKSQLISLESPVGDVQEVKSTLTSLAEIESELDLNEQAQELAQNDMFMDWSGAMYFLATKNWEEAGSSLDLYDTLSDTMTSLLTEHDDLMAQKIALLQGQ